MSVRRRAQMKQSPWNRWAVAGAACGAFLAGLDAALAQVDATMGTAHFFDGQKLGTGTFIAAVAGQPAPFNQFIGSDAAGPNFDAKWTMTYAAPGAAISSASLTLGIYDADSAGNSSALRLFSINGIDATAALQRALAGHGGANDEYDIYTVLLPSSTFAALASGQAAFEVALQGNGLSVLGPTDFNGAGIDFAKLSIAVPEPAEAALAVEGAALLWLRARRRKV